MTFDHPLLLILAPVLALVFGALAWVARRRRVERARAWSPEIAGTAAGHGRWYPLVFGLIGLAMGVAIAGPRGGRAEVTSESRSLSVVFAVDISRSMLAEDIAPSRLQRATREIRRLVQDLGGDRQGLIAFAGRSYILTPLTVDGGSISLFLEGLDPDLASEGGTSLGTALAQGGELLAASNESADKVLVVFTDGETHDSLPQTLTQARALSSLGVRLILVSEGQSAPARIPVRDSSGTLIEYQQDEDGHVIETSRRDDVLQAVADAAEGTLVPSQLPDQAGAVRDLVAVFKRSSTTETTTADLLPQAWIPILLAVLLLVGQTLRRKTAALVGIAGLLLVRPLAAQRLSAGDRAMAEGKGIEAARAYLDQAREGIATDTAYYNAGTAALEAGQMDVARRALKEASHSLDPDLRYRALYNMGVAALRAAQADSLRRQDLLEEAAGHLQEALMLEPGSMRAKWNLELARRHRPPPPSGGGGGSPPPPQGGQGNPAPEPSKGSAADLSESQAEQILNSVDREERGTRTRHLGKPREPRIVVKNW